MTALDSAIPIARGPISSPSRAGLGWGFLGVLAFSFTVPLTRGAIHGFSPLFFSAGRAVVAGILAVLTLLVTRQSLPSARQFRRLAVVALGVVAGFPILTSFALQTAPASHGAVVVGLLPAATAIMAVIRGRERPSLSFWIAGAAGIVAVVVFTLVSGGGFGGFHLADLLLVLAVACAAVGYAEGGLLSRELGSWQTICWALVLALPVMALLTGLSLRQGVPTAGMSGWAAFAYVSLISMFLGFFAWYRGLAIGPIASVSQIQLVQSVLSIAWAWLLLGEQPGMTTVIGAVAVIGCAALAVRARVASAR